MSERCSAVLAEIEHAIEALVVPLRAGTTPPRRLLDVGCWDGRVTERYARALRCAAFGVEIFEEPAAVARGRGIGVVRLDLERDPLPWADGSMDVVIANQVFEHLKNIWLPMSEVFRVLRPGGHLVFSVPNLASLHNRLMLGLGMQPSSIRTLGPHVRGYTGREVRRFLELGGGLRVARAVGVGFYPLPARLAGPLARVWPAASHTIVFLAQRVREGGEPPWNAWLRGEDLQTAYP